MVPVTPDRTRHVTTAVVLTATAVALAVTLTVSLSSPAQLNGLPADIPAIPTVAPPAAPPGGPGASAPAPGNPLPTLAPSAPPPLPAQSGSPAGAPPSPRPQPPPRLTPVSYEAESAEHTLSGRAGVHTIAEASGGRTVGWLGRGEANTLRFNGISVPAAGTYTVTVFYISGDGSRAAAIRANRSAPGAVTFPATRDWRTVGSLAIRIELEAGNNSIEFGNPEGPAPDIDRIVLG
jgi:hypothetical protein